ncbi:beta-centractin-like [Folsomia candida]|uniref:beta-centractin-like n=1 Tax=Folsomia candida TaxID=158441 RepID=UPI00160512AD|nr:beta-centractin-like [Folsomia candida]
MIVRIILTNDDFNFNSRRRRTTGVVLDAGDGVTHAVPIYEGGRDVTRYLRFLLRKEGINFRTSSEFEIVRRIKERECYLSANPSKDSDSDPDADKRIYKLPDGTQLDIGQARFRAPEILFRPDLRREEREAMHEVLLFSIQKSDTDLRKILFQNIVLFGGSTLFKVKAFRPRRLKFKKLHHLKYKDVVKPISVKSVAPICVLFSH